MDMSRLGRGPGMAIHTWLGTAVLFSVGVLDLRRFRPCVDGVDVEKDVYDWCG